MPIDRRRPPLALSAILAAALLCLAPAASAQPDGAWTAVTRLAGGANVTTYDIVLGPTGEAVAVWAVHDGATYAVKAARRRAGATAWGDAQTVQSGSRSVSDLHVAIGAAGDVTAIWNVIGGGDADVFAARSAAGVAPAAWSDSTSLSGSGCTGDAQLPRVAMSASGDAAVIWRCFDGGAGKTWVQGATYSTATGRWSDAADVSSNEDSTANEDPYVAMNASGDGIAVWRHTEGDAHGVQASFLRDGSWSAPDDVSATASNGRIAQPVVDASGRATVAWEDSSRWVLRASSNALPGTAWPDPSDLSVPGSNVLNPQLVIAPDDAVLAVWNTYNADPDSFTIHSVRRASAGGSWSSPTDVATSASGDLVWIPSLHAVGATGSGDAWIVWSQGPYDESTSSVRTAAYDTATDRWSAPDVLVPTRPNDDEAVIGVADDGTAVALFGDGAGDVDQSSFVLATPPAPPAPTSIRWSSAAGGGSGGSGRIVIAPGQPLAASFPAAPGTTYRITARSLARRVITGTCVKRAAKVRCSIRLPRAGRWLVQITPRKGGVDGTPARLRVRVRAVAPRPEPITG